MRFRGLLVAALLLAVLGGGVWYSNKLEKAKEGKPATDAPPKILEIPADQIQQVDITKAGETTSLKRGSDSKWELASPKPLRADQDSVNSLINTFTTLNSERLIEEKASDSARFGLASPSMTVTVSKKDGKISKLLLGDETPTGSGVFARLDGDPRVFTLASWNKTSLDKNSKDLRDKRLLTFDSDKLSRLELSVKSQTVEFGKNNQNEWQVVRPKPLRADGGQVEDLIRKLKDAKMDPAVSDVDAKKFAAAFAGAKLVAVAKVTDAAGAQQLEIRQAADKTYYTKSSVVEGVHKAASDLGDGVNKSPDDFRNKKLFDFGWSDPGKVEITSAGKTRNLEKKADKWMEANKQMDSTSVQALIDKLRELAATRYPESGFTSPMLEARVTSNEGKRVEKVMISKSGDKYVARRDNEPSLYEVDTKAVEEILKAAGDVKEPPPPKKDDTKKKK